MEEEKIKPTTTLLLYAMRFNRIFLTPHAWIRTRMSKRYPSFSWQIFNFRNDFFSEGHTVLNAAKFLD
jgi:hypothetical protein